MLSMTVRVPSKLGKKLANLSRKTGRTKSFYVRQALEHDLEDMEDAFLADQSWEKVRAGGEVFTHEEICARYGIG